MSDKETPTDVLKRMLRDAADADTVDDLALPGTYAKQYGDTVQADLNADNVDAFLHGASVVNLLVQEAILRVSTVAQASEPDTKEQEIYSEGVKDGSMLIAQIMGGVVDDLIQSMIEGPAFERAFNGIVNNF